MKLIKNVDALNMRHGPTQSGIEPNISPAVGGEVVPTVGGEILSLIILTALLVFGFLIYKRGNIFLKLLRF